MKPPEEVRTEFTRDWLQKAEGDFKTAAALSKSSIDFFKKEAKRNRTSYQKMIRRVVDSYASHYHEGA